MLAFFMAFNIAVSGFCSGLVYAQEMGDTSVTSGVDAESGFAAEAGGETNPSGGARAEDKTGKEAEDKTGIETEEKTEEAATEQAEEETEDAEETEKEAETAEEGETDESIGGAIRAVKEEDGLIISVDAPEGAFPAGTTAFITKLVSDEQAISYDITFRDSEEKEMQPAEGKEVEVSFTLDSSSQLIAGKESVDLKLYHIVDGVTEEIAAETVSDESVTLHALVSHFSEFKLTAEENAELSEHKSRDGADEKLVVTLSGSKLEGSPLDLEESGVTGTASYKSSFTLHVEATYSAGTDKTLEISLPHGMAFASDYSGSANKNSSWYKEELEKETLPFQQQEALKKPVKIELTGETGRNGTLTYQFKDSTETVSFDLPVYTTAASDELIMNLHHIQDAVKVSKKQTSLDGSAVETIKKIDDLELTGYAGKVTAGKNNYSRFVNENNHLPVALGGDSGNTVVYMAADPTPNWTSKRLLEDYYVSFLVPEGTSYKGLYDKNLWLGENFENPEIKNAGETYTTSKGTTETVPSGKTLYTFRSKGMMATATSLSDARSRIVPIWEFADEDKFPVGTVVEVKMVDVGVRYSSQGETQEYLPYDESKLPSATYEIVDREEETFVERKYEKAGSTDTSRAGYVSDITLNLGSPGQEYTQEYRAGYFIIGNRGTADSQAKRITLEYDTNKTGLIGVTGQLIPRNKGIEGVADTEITNFQYKLWNAKTNTETDWISWNPAREIPEELTITDVSGDPDVYLKAIQYDVDTIPSQSYLGIRGNGISKSFDFYGKALTNKVVSVSPDPVPAGNAAQYLSTVKVENIDGSDSILGRHFTGTSGTVVMPGVHKSYGREGNLSVVAGETKRLGFTVWGAGSGGTAGIVNKIWIISPNGSKIDNWKICKRFVFKGNRADFYDENNSSWVTDDISSLIQYKEIPATSELKEKYPDARLYEFDFTNISENSQDDYFRARVIGPQMRTIKRADGARPASWDAYWFSVGNILIEGDYHSDINETPLTKERYLTWVEMKSDTEVTNEDGSEKTAVYTQNYEDDQYKLSDNGSKLVSNNALTVYQQSKLVVDVAIKEASKPDSAYRTYNLEDEGTVVGLDAAKSNQIVNYKLDIQNVTGKPALGVDVYFPIPKKGNNWGKDVTPKGAFNFDMNLEGSVKDRVPDNYKVYYVKGAIPNPNTLTWPNYAWVEDKDTASWTSDDWKQVNFVRIERTTPLETGKTDQMVFDMVVDNQAPVKKLDAWRAGFKYQYDTSSGWGSSKAVAASVLDGAIGGLVWHDVNHDGKIDEAEPIVRNAVVKLYSKDSNGKRWNLLEEVKTGDDGRYVFSEIWSDKTYEVEVKIPDEYDDFTITGDGLDNVFAKNGGGSDRLGSVDVEVKEAVKLTEKNAGLLKPNDAYTRQVPVTKLWVGGTGSPVTIHLYADGAEVDSVVLGDTNGWQHSFTSLEQYRNGQAIQYTITEDPVAGYQTEITGDMTTGFTVKNTKLDVPKDNPPGSDTPDKPKDNPSGGNTSDSPKDNSSGGTISDKPQAPPYVLYKTSVRVTKLWAGTPTDSITVHLYADGEKVDSRQLSAATNWQFTFTDLNQYKEGKEIVYTVAEEEVPGYTALITGDARSGFVITNTQTAPQEPSQPAPPHSPRTGDDMNILLYGGLMAVSLLAVIFLIRRRRIR